MGKIIEKKSSNNGQKIRSDPKQHHKKIQVIKPAYIREKVCEGRYQIVNKIN